jgi:acid phosphatase family membrane protein YuiD
MATSVGLVSGWLSVDFAIALGVAMVVMYDAAGLRRAAGRMAGVLNHMMEEVYRHHSESIPERLRELLGHTPFEVFVGALFGIVWSIVLHAWLATPVFSA